MEKGLVHLYTGDGKGKTTAAVGLAVRAAGAGKKVLFVQFMKGRDTGELHSLAQIGGIRVLRSSRDFGFYRSMSEEQKRQLTQIHNGLLMEVLSCIREGAADMVVLDEVTYPVKWRLLDEALLREILAGEGGVLPEIVCTGRDAAAFLLERADYVTEMKCIRHPYEKGIAAREGVEF